MLASGLALVAVACALLTGIGVGGSYWADLLPGFVLFGPGLGLAIVSATIAATTGIPGDEQGFASGLLSTAQQVGFATGVAALVTVAVSRTKHLTSGSAAERLLSGFHLGLWVAAAIALVGIPLALSIRRPSGAEPLNAEQPAMSA